MIFWQVNAQKSPSIKYSDLTGTIPPRILAKKDFKDSARAVAFLSELVIDYQGKGFLLARIDTSFFKEDTLFFSMDLGEKFDKNSIRLHPADRQLLRRVGYKTLKGDYLKLQLYRLPVLQKNIINHLENAGYPFARVVLDSVQSDSVVLTGRLLIAPGPYIIYDTLGITGKTRTKARYLERYTGLEREKTYRQSNVNRAKVLIDRLPFIKTTGPPSTVFAKGKAEITFPVADQKANRLDGIIGVLPNSSNNNELVLTGEFNLNLMNLFTAGHSLNFNWKRFDALSQTLNINYSYPFVAGTPLGAAGYLTFLKQDSSFQTLDRKAEVFTAGGSLLRSAFFFGINSSTVISSKKFEGATSLPEVADYSRTYYGLEFSFDKRNDFYFPRRGVYISQQASLGSKKIFKNSVLDEKLYEGVKLKTLQFSAQFAAQKYFSLSKSGVFFLSGTAAGLFNEDRANIFLNELYRLGGFKLMRGFNENFFYATQYGVITAEWRQFTDESSYLYAFVDQSFIKAEFREISREDTPTGFGVGISFAVPAGIFNFAYSLGRSREQEAIPSLSKIHFGFISRF